MPLSKERNRERMRLLRAVQPELLAVQPDYAALDEVWRKSWVPHCCDCQSATLYPDGGLRCQTHMTPENYPKLVQPNDSTCPVRVEGRFGMWGA